MFIADCKAASLETRATISNEEGFYLFPLPMTGETPELLKSYVLNPPIKPEKIVLGPKAADEMKEDAENRLVGEGFSVERQMETTLPDGKVHKWVERWLVCQSYAHKNRKIKGFKKRLARAEEKLKKLKVKKDESAADFQKRAERILKEHKVSDFIVLEIKESIKRKRKYIGKGRPGPNRPYRMEKIRTVTLFFNHDNTAIEEFKTLAGWRVYVSNIPEESMSLTQSAQYYRDEYVVEHGFHRLKKGNLPVLPLFLRIDDRIRGLMLILTIALQALTLLEFVARRELATNRETLSGLVPGNPKMKTHRPTAERLLPAFDNLHMIIDEGQTQTKGYLLESLNALQRKILDLLGIPLEAYNLNFARSKLKNSS
jgi:transposase